MGTVTYGQKKIDDLLAKKAAGLKHITAPKNVEFLIKVEFDAKIEKAAQKDPLLRQEFEDAANDTVDRFVEFVGLKMKATDDAVQKLLEANKTAEVEAAKKKMNADIEQMRGSACQFGVMQVQKAWDELARKKSEYKKYRIKIGVTIGLAIAGMATSIGLLASAPFTGGASAALTIVGICKSGATIAKETAAAAMDFETAARSLQGQIQVVKAVWSKTKAGGHANEVAASVINQFIGQSQPSIKMCQDWMGRCEQKLNGIEVNAHGLAKSIEKMKADLSKLEEQFMAEAAKRLAKHPSGKGAAQLRVVRDQFHRAVDGFETQINATGQKVLEQVRRAKEGRTQVVELKKQVTALSAYRGNAYRVIDNLLMLTDVATSGMSGNGLVQAFNEMAGTFGSAAASIAIDRVTKAALEGTFLE